MKEDDKFSPFSIPQKSISIFFFLWTAYKQSEEEY